MYGEVSFGGNTLTETLFLNCVIRWDPASAGAETEADTSDVAMVLRDLGLEKSSPAATPVAKRPKSEELVLLAGAKPLNAEVATLYRSVTMCVNYLSVDRPDLSLAAGSLARGMKSPTTKALEELTRVGRYLRGRPLEAIVFEPQTLLAGDQGTRKSRSGMAVMCRAHLIKHHHRTDQWRIRILRIAQVVSPCARNQGNAERRYGAKCEIRMRCDGSAARGMSCRGPGKTRHMCASCQQAVQDERLKVLSVPTKVDADRCYRCMNFHLRSVGSGLRVFWTVAKTIFDHVWNVNSTKEE